MLTAFNSPYDTALRTIASLVAFGREGVSFELIRYLDTFLVFPVDVGGEGHLHPLVDGRLMGYFFRDGHVRLSIDLLGKAGLVRSEGERYVFARGAALSGPAFATEYGEGLAASGRWIRDECDRVGPDAFSDRCQARLREARKRGLGAPPRELERLVGAYRSDLARLEAVGELARWLPRISRDREIAVESRRMAEIASGEMRSTTSKLSDLRRFLTEEPLIAALASAPGCRG